MCVCFAQVGDFADANSWPTPGEIATKDMQVGVGARFEKRRLIETVPTLTKRQNLESAVRRQFLVRNSTLNYFTKRRKRQTLKSHQSQVEVAQQGRATDVIGFYSLFQLKVTDMRCVWR